MNNKSSCKWNVGYCIANLEVLDPLQFKWIKNVATQCKKFVIGIPDKDIMMRVYGNRDDYNPQYVKEFWSEIRWIDEVVILNVDQLCYSKMYEKILFDVCFYGSRYGMAFEKDIEFMKEKGIEFVSLLPEKIRFVEGFNAIEKPLKQIYLRKKLVLFGTGVYFEQFIKTYGKRYKPEYAIDNDSEKWGTTKYDILIQSPDVLYNENPEEILVVICSKKYQEMLQQIRAIGDFDYRLLLFYNETAILEEERLVEDIDVDKLVLKKVHKINLAMLKEFDKVCRAHNVQYFLNYGSCIGAIRHKGFIPWDNDVDTCMTRENYEKLFPWTDEFGDIYRFVPPDDLGRKKYLDCVPRLNYKNAYMRMDEDVTKYYENHNNRIDLDIFLIDKTYDDFKGKFQRFELAVLYGLMNAYRHESFFADYSRNMRIANAILKRVGRCFTLNWLRKRVDKVAKRFNKDSSAPYYFISNCALCKLKVLFPVEVFSESIDVPFEDLMASVPVGYDEFLRRIYGDYMKIPPKHKQVPHWGRILITSDYFVFEEPTT